MTISATPAPATAASPVRQSLFGTDGVRGPANRGAMTPEQVLRLGQAAAEVLLPATGLADNGSRPLAIIGRDPRWSGSMLEGALAAGLASRGIDVALAGVVPTPAIAALIRRHRAAFGAVISASHNPPPDNGIKFFNADGYKPDDAQEAAMEDRVLGRADAAGGAGGPGGDWPDGLGCGRVNPLEHAGADYIEACLETLAGTRLDGLRIVVDPGHGAACHTSPEILRRTGANVIAHFDRPDGGRINVDCGCTHPQVLRQLVTAEGADVGIAHDGDADRVVLCDETGAVLDGDELMAILALDLLERDQLRQRTLVTTVMSNHGLVELLQRHGAKVLRTPVGDRHVIAAMREHDCNLGGEQSGHIILRDHNTTGDGIVAALAVLGIMRRRGLPLSRLRACLVRLHQARRDFTVPAKPPVEELREAGGLIRETEAAMAGGGRTLLRYSGTEPLIRLLIEGADEAYIEAQADRIAAAIRRDIGA